MDIHNFPSMPSEPDSTAACRFSSWNIMGHSHSLVEKCWKRFGAFKTLLPVPVEAENSTFRWASLEMCWNVLNQKDPTMNMCLFFCVFSSEKYIIMRGCWLNFGEVIPCHTHCSMPCRACASVLGAALQLPRRPGASGWQTKIKTQDSISNILQSSPYCIHDYTCTSNKSSNVPLSHL